MKGDTSVIYWTIWVITSSNECEKNFSKGKCRYIVFLSFLLLSYSAVGPFFKEEIQLKANMWPAYDTNCTLAAVHCMIDLQYFHCNWYITAHETVIAYLNRYYVLFQRFYFESWKQNEFIILNNAYQLLLFWVKSSPFGKQAISWYLVICFELEPPLIYAKLLCNLSYCKRTHFRSIPHGLKMRHTSYKNVSDLTPIC